MDLTAEYSLKSAVYYARPRSTSDVLPIVYGDLTTGGVKGVWTMPCIDTTGYIYAYAGAPVLTVANGNAITVYDKDGAVIAGANYAFSASNNVESNGAIATVTFTSDYSSYEPITVKGKGRADSAGTSLLTNPVDILYDFLVNLAGLRSDEVNATAKAQAWAICAAQGYAAAGLIDANQSVGQTLSDVFGCFLGSWFLGPDRKVWLSINTGPGTVNEGSIAGLFGRSVTETATVEADSVNLCNQVRASYAYNWATQEYDASDEGASTYDLTSRGVYGEQIQEMEWPWIRSATIANTIQALIVAAYKWPARIYSVTQPSMVNSPLMRGDIAALSSRWILDNTGQALANQLVRVLSIDQDLSARAIAFRLLDTGLFKTAAYAADGTYDADGSALAGGGRDTEDYA